MRNDDQNKFLAGSENFLKKIALKPFSGFFFLLAVFAAVSAFIFFSFQRPADSEGAVPEKKLFGPAKAREYREVFSILSERSGNGAAPATSTYPDVFLHSPELTNPEN